MSTQSEDSFTKPHVTVEYTDGKRFKLPIDDNAIGKTIVFDKPTYAAGDEVPLGARVKAVTAGTNDFSALNPVGGQNGNGTYAQDEEFEVTVAHAVVPQTLSVSAIEIIPTLVAN
jgi:hypothetical protein